MKQTKRHITGDDMTDALLLLQTLADNGASGIFRSCYGEMRLRDGRVVKLSSDLLDALLEGEHCASWSWRKVPGSPNGDMNASLPALLLAASTNKEG